MASERKSRLTRHKPSVGARAKPEAEPSASARRYPIVTYTRIDGAMSSQIEAHREALQRVSPAMPITTAIAIRDLIIRGLRGTEVAP